MGGGASVEIAHIVTHVNRYDPSTKILTRVSTFLFAQPALPKPDDLKVLSEDSILKAKKGSTPGFATGKIGILLDPQHQLHNFLLLFEDLQYPVKLDSSVKQDLDETFGQGSKWSGYSVALPPPTDRFQLHALLEINVNFNFHQKSRRHQGLFAVPMIFGYYGVSFAEHYALGVTTLQPDETSKVDTSVRLRT
jgi:hypothetical protein